METTSHLSPPSADVSRPDPASEAGSVQGPPLPPSPSADSTIVVAVGKKKRRPNASGPSKTSSFWDHFTKEVNDDPAAVPKAFCNYCKKSYFCHTKLYGTSSLSGHLRTCKKYAYAIHNDPTQTVLTLGKNNEGLFATSCKFNLEACRAAVARFIILDEYSFRAVEREGFKQLVHQLEPQFTPPSRQSVTRDCYQLYLDEKLKLRSLFRLDYNKVALTTDCWTSIQNINYLTLTAHFIDSRWRYNKRIISFSNIANHRGETIGMHIEEILRDWGLRKVFSITVNNASSNDVAVNYLKNKFNTFNGLVLDGEFFHFRCCAHILNLVVVDGLKDMHSSITTIRTTVRYVRSSPQRLAKFKECVEQCRISSRKLVCLDISTRWNSTYLMLEAAEKFEMDFEKLDFEDSNFRTYFGSASPPTHTDFEHAQVFVKFLKMFFDATNILSVSTNITMHSVFSQLSEILIELNEVSINLNTIYATIGFEMKKKYEKYWGQVSRINHLVYFGVIIDPRYKLSFVEWSFKDMYPSDPQLVMQLSHDVRQNISRLYAWYASNQPSQPNSEPSFSSSITSPPLNSVPTSRSARADMFKVHLREKNSIDDKNELERYLAESILNSNDQFDLLLWWKQNSARFPILSQMARDILGVPVSTMASQSSFSTGGRVLEPFRSSLSPQMTEALICVQNWLRPSQFQFKDMDLGEDLEESENVVSDLSAGRARMPGT